MNASKDRPLVVGIGEVLWDMLPGGRKLGGAPANFAWHAGQLGARGVTISAVGREALGTEILGQLESAKLERGFVNVVQESPTSTVSVTCDAAGQPHYVIHENVAWDRIPCTEAMLDLVRSADSVCVGTLAQRSSDSRSTIQRLLDVSGRDCIRVFDINLRQSYYDVEVIETTLRKSTVLKFNDGELAVLTPMLELPGDPETALTKLLDRYSLRMVACTCGSDGSLLCSANGVSRVAGKEVAVADTVGAGDSFTAALVVGLLRGERIEQIHQTAAEVAAYVCTQAGAMPTLPESLKFGSLDSLDMK